MSAANDIKKLVAKAIDKRKSIIEDSETNCLRVFHGYEEGLKGVVAEKFGPLLVVNHKVPFDSELSELTNQLDSHLKVDTIVTKNPPITTHASKICHCS